MSKAAPGSGHYVKRQTLTTSVAIALMVGFVAGLVFGVYKSPSQLPAGAPGAANPGAGRAGMLARLEEQVRANPKDVEAWIQIGHINFDNQQHQAAIEAYEKALAINPDNAPVLLAHCGGAIVGTALKAGGRVDRPVEVARVRAIRAAFDAAAPH